MKMIVDSVLERVEVRAGPEPAAMFRDSRRVRQLQELPAGTPTRRCVIMRESDARLSKTTDTRYSERPAFNNDYIKWKPAKEK